MALQEFGGPAFPFQEQRFERRRGPRRVSRTSNWPALGGDPARASSIEMVASREKRLVKHRQIADDHRQEPEARAGLDHGQEPTEYPRGCHIAEADREKCGSAQIQISPEAAGSVGNTQTRFQRPMQKPEANYKAEHPPAEQAQNPERAEYAQEVFAPFSRCQRTSNRTPEGPAGSIVRPRKSKIAANPARIHHRLESFQQDRDDERDAPQPDNDFHVRRSLKQVGLSIFLSGRCRIRLPSGRSGLWRCGSADEWLLGAFQRLPVGGGIETRLRLRGVVVRQLEPQPAPAQFLGDDQRGAAAAKGSRTSSPGSEQARMMRPRSCSGIWQPCQPARSLNVPQTRGKYQVSSSAREAVGHVLRAQDPGVVGQPAARIGAAIGVDELPGRRDADRGSSVET